MPSTGLSIVRETTKAKYDAFCREYLSNGNNGAKAAIYVGYSEKSARQTAKELLDKPYISDKIRQLQKEITEKHSEKFTISLEQRLEWLQKAVSVGFREVIDAQGNPKAENLQASISAIKELNVMLGTDSHAEVKPVKVFVGVQDAS